MQMNTSHPFRFLESTISNDLSWEISGVSTIKKAQQRLYFIFLCQLKKFGIRWDILVQFY